MNSACSRISCNPCFKSSARRTASWESLTGLGIVDYLTKPIDIHQFIRAVRGVVG